MHTVSDLFKIKNNLKPSAGRVIISEPLSTDGYFGRSVVLINEHNENGTVGYILNKTSRLTVGHFFDEFKKYKIPIFIGGPVATDTLHFIHRTGAKVPNSTKVKSDLYWGGDMNELPELLEKKAILARDLKFFIGYSGWEVNQLENEIEKNFWVVSTLDTKTILARQVKEYWSKVVEKAGKDYKFWLNIPEDILSN